MKSTENKIYNGDMAAGALLIAESRKIAQLLLKNLDEVQWHKAIVIDNILQKRSSAAAIRQARLIKNRLILTECSNQRYKLWKNYSLNGMDRCNRRDSCLASKTVDIVCYIF